MGEWPGHWCPPSCCSDTRRLSADNIRIRAGRQVRWAWAPGVNSQEARQVPTELAGPPGPWNLASPKANPSPAAGPRSFVSEPGAWGSSWCGVSMRKLRGPYGYRQPLAGCRSGRAGSTWAAGCEGISHPVNEFSEHHSPHLADWHIQTSRALVDRSRWPSPSAGLGRP